MKAALPSAVLAACLVSACGVPRAPVSYGDANAIIVVTPDELWQQVADTVERALQPRIFTVRAEKAFRVTQVSPAAPSWDQMRLFRQVVVIGLPESGWVRPVLEKAQGPLPQPPALVDAHDVWANQQVVTALLLPDHDYAAAVEKLLPELYGKIDARYRDYVARRMFMSGVDSDLADSLAAFAGFSLTLPKVYRHAHEDDAWVFTNSIATPKELYRTITVASRPGTPALSSEDVLEWRDSVAARHYPRPQVTVRPNASTRTVRTEAGPVMEVSGVWETPRGLMPAGGPFVDHVVPCPRQDRTYLIDAWLYAPTSDKYEYMLQLHAILGTFKCRP